MLLEDSVGGGGVWRVGSGLLGLGEGGVHGEGGRRRQHILCHRR